MPEIPQDIQEESINNVIRKHIKFVYGKLKTQVDVREVFQLVQNSGFTDVDYEYVESLTVSIFGEVQDDILRYE